VARRGVGWRRRGKKKKKKKKWRFTFTAAARRGRARRSLARLAGGPWGDGRDGEERWRK
jgi:hypothetical protein